MKSSINRLYSLAAALFFCFVASPAFSQWTNSGGHAYLTNTAKNVGIGNTSPASRLHLTGSNNLMRLQATTSTGYLSFYSNTSDYVGYAGIFNGAKNLEFGTGSGNPTGNMQLVTQALPRLVINPAGNVAIGGGITSPKVKLQVLENTNDTTAIFHNSFTPNANTVALGATIAPVAGSFANAVAVKGVANVSTYAGIGGQFEGGLYSGHFSNGELFAKAKNGIHSIHVEAVDAEAAYFSATNGHGISAWATGAGKYAGNFTGNVYATGVFTSSDARLKRSVQPMRDALSKIAALRPATYDFDTEEFDFLNLPRGPQIGLLAQELEQVFPECVREVTADEHHCGEQCKHGKNHDGFTFKAVNYPALVPVLIAGMQEQQAEIESQKQEISRQNERLAWLEKRLASIELAADRTPAQPVSRLSSLSPCSPNPVVGTAHFPFFVEKMTHSAQLVLTEMASGRLLKTIELPLGEGIATIETDGLPTGSFACSLLIDGQVVASQTMVVVSR